MRCSVARLCERTVGRRVPPLWAGGGLLHTTPHCVVVTVLGAEPWSFATRTEPRLVLTGAELRRYGKPHCSLRWGLERAEHSSGGQGTESRALRSAGVAGGRLPAASRVIGLADDCQAQAPAGLGSNVAGRRDVALAPRSRTPLEHQPQQATRRHDQDDDH